MPSVGPSIAGCSPASRAAAAWPAATLDPVCAPGWPKVDAGLAGETVLRMSWSEFGLGNKIVVGWG